MAPGTVSDPAGGLLESFASAEIRRQLVWAETPARLFHFRDRDGLEVELVIESDDRRIAGIETKAAGSVNLHDFKGLAVLRDKLNDRFTLGVVLYTGTQALPLGDRLWALPYSAIWSGT
jgi:predicted AAA+ superfamily ATPase